MVEKNEEKNSYKIIAQYEEYVQTIIEECRKNREANRYDEDLLENLDSSMKRNTSFVKKIKLFSELNMNSLMQEIDQLNLKNYLQEIAMGLFECKYKISSIPYLMLVLSKIHRSYHEFHELLYTTTKEKLVHMIRESKNLDDTTSPQIPNENNNTNNINKEAQIWASNLTTIVCLFCEMILFDMVPRKKHREYYTTIRSVLLLYFEDSTYLNQNYISMITQLFRLIGIEYMAIIPRKLKLELLQKYQKIELPEIAYVVDDDIQKWISQELHNYFKKLSDYYVEDCEKLNILEQSNNHIIGLRGELSTEKKEEYEQLQSCNRKIKKWVDSLANTLDMDCPSFEIKVSNSSVVLDRLGENIEVILPEKDTDAFNLLLWDDNEIKSFYVDLPSVKFKDQTPITNKLSFYDYKKKITQKRLKTIKETMKTHKDECDYNEDDMDLLDYETRNVTKYIDENTMSSHMINYINKLQLLVNRDLINNAAFEFLETLCSKKNRKILVQVLHGRTRFIQLRLGLLPFFSRLIAILSQIFPEIGYEIVDLLTRDIRFHVRKKNPKNIEYKQKLIKYIAELTLFDVCPKMETISIAKLFLNEFYGHNIDMLCTLLDSCGRYLFINHDSHQYTKSLLEILIRKVKYSIIDGWRISQLENACLSCNPVAALNYKDRKTKKSKDPLLAYIKFLLYTTLTRKTSHENFHSLLMIPFQYHQVYWYLVKCFSRPWKFKFSLIDLVVSMLSALYNHKKHLVNAVIDKVIESITCLMESCDFRNNQKILCAMVYIGEIYNFRLISFDTIIKILYRIISYRFVISNGQYINIDPDNNLIRIRMICESIKTIYPTINLNNETHRKQLCDFLLYFQCYYWDKKLSKIYDNERLFFPYSIDMVMQETFQSINYLIPFYETCDEARTAFETHFNVDMSSDSYSIQQAATPIAITQLMDTNDNDDSINIDKIENFNEFDDNLSDFSPQKYIELEYDRLIQERYRHNYCMGTKKNIAINIPHAVLMSSSSSSQASDNEYDTTANNHPSGVMSTIHSSSGSHITTTIVPNSKDIKIKFVARKNKKPISKDVVIPANSYLAADISNRKQIEKKEMEHIKNLVLTLEKLQTNEIDLTDNLLDSRNYSPTKSSQGGYILKNSKHVRSE